MPKEGALTRLRKLGLPRDDLEYLVNQWVKKEPDKTLVKYCVIDEMTIERASELVDRTPRYSAEIIKRYCKELLLHT